LGKYKITLETSLDVKELRKQLKQIEGSEKIKITVDSSQATQQIRAMDADYGKLTSSVVKNGLLQRETYTKVADGITTITKVQGDNITQTTKAAKAAMTFGEHLQDAFSKLSSWTLALEILRLARFAVEDMVQQVKVLDDSLTELKKVTDLEGKSLDEFINKAYDLSTTVAKTGSDMVDAATEFAKSGYDNEQILQLGQIALLYTNIADEELNAGDAASFIIAQMKAFNIEADNAISVVDALNEVSNNYAVSSADLATSIGKVSSTMAASGTTYQETLGLLTAITEITRDAGKAANALKTISQRLRGVGEDGEDTTKYISKLQEQFDKLGINVEIVKQNGAMESTFNILSALAEKWNDLNDAQRQNIGELAAGKNRITELNALMSNFGVAISATETAMNSMGSATRENEAVLDSIQGHINKLKSAWQNLARKTISSDFVKSIVDAGTTLVKFVDSDVGKVIIAIGSLTLAFKILTTASFKFVAANSSLMGLMAALVVSFKAGALGATGFTAVLKGTAAALGTLTTALLSNPLFWGTAIVGGIIAITNHLKKLQEEQLNHVSTINKETEALENQINSINDYAVQLKVAYESVDTLKEKQDTLVNYQKNIIGKYKEEIETLTNVKNANDLLNMSYDETVNVLKNVEKGLLDKQVAALNEGQVDREKLLSTKTVNIFGDLDDYLDATGTIKDEYRELFETMKNIADENNVIISQNLVGDLGVWGNVEQAVRFYNQMEEAIISMNKESQSAWGEMKSNTEFGTKSMQEDWNKFHELEEQANEAEIKSFKQSRWDEYWAYKTSLEQKNKLFQEYNKAETYAEKEEISKKINELQPEIDKTYSQLYSGAGKKIKESLDKELKDVDVSKMLDFNIFKDIGEGEPIKIYDATDFDNLLKDLNDSIGLTDNLKNKIIEFRDALELSGKFNEVSEFDKRLKELGLTVNEDAIRWKTLIDNISDMESYAEGASALWGFIKEQGITNIDELADDLVKKLSSGKITFEEFFAFLHDKIVEAGGDVDTTINEVVPSIDSILTKVTDKITFLQKRI
jgi:TP901 family phage tail tape measure protein